MDIANLAAQGVILFIVFGAVLGFAMLLWCAFRGLFIAGRSVKVWNENQRYIRETLAGKHPLPPENKLVKMGHQAEWN